jgi:signal transduction histidine kinase
VGRRRLELSWQNRLPEKVDVDGSAVRQIALNLLLNACAASPTAGIVAFDARAAGREFRMTVSDAGPGLPSEIELLYRNPVQVSRAPTERMGLGVWTVCHMVSRLGGRIEIDTGFDRGTTVTIRLPMGREEALDAVA